MPYKITKSIEGSTTTVQIHGRLTVEGIPDLERECHPEEASLCLDLTYLKSADREGIRALKTLAANGARLVGASAYVRLLLDREGSGSEMAD